jgi:hypothetical protein
MGAKVKWDWNVRDLSWQFVRMILKIIYEFDKIDMKCLGSNL